MNQNHPSALASSMRREARAKLRETAEVLLPLLQEAAETLSDEKVAAQVDGLWLSGDYIRSTAETLTRLVNGEPISYKALYQSITLEMMANSTLWCQLRLWARRLT